MHQINTQNEVLGCLAEMRRAGIFKELKEGEHFVKLLLLIRWDKNLYN